MPTTLSDASVFEDPVKAPADGDTCDAASVEGAHDVAVQALSNRTRWLKNALPLGAWVGWRPYVRAATSDAHLYVGVATALFADGLASLVAEAAVPLSGLTPSTWYYLYARNAFGLLAFETSTTAPDVSLTFKSGDATRLYVCAFYATSATQARPFRARAGVYRYLGPINGASTGGFTGGTGSVLTQVGVQARTSATIPAALMPPHARIAKLAVSLVTQSNVGGSAAVGTPGEAAFAGAWWTQSFAGTPVAYLFDHADVQTDASHALDYATANDATLVFEVYCVGFEEP